MRPIELLNSGELLAAAVSRLDAAGVEAPRLDAELLLSEVLQCGRAALIADSTRPIGAAAAKRFDCLLARRAGREPIAYILGRKGFRRIELRCDRRALIPRPETELLVEVALQRRPSSVLDIGTGSGAIALAIADELPDVAVTATDTSVEALQLANENARLLGLGDRVGFVTADELAGRSFSLVVANLPYISDRDLASLAVEIREFEPDSALRGGPDGLDVIRRVVAELPRCDTVALEIGSGQAAAGARILAAAGFEAIEVWPDLAGIERVLIGQSR